MTHSRVSTVDWEDDVYAKGQQFNHWPYSDLVSAVFRATSGRDRSQVRVLEVGCGAGNNVFFLADEGFQATGLDISASAIEYGRQRLESRGLSADMRVNDLVDLPFEDGSFDIVLDRGVFTQNSIDNIAEAVREAHRVLVDGGTLFCFDLIGSQHPDWKYGREVSPSCYDEFTGGLFASVGLTAFVTDADVERVFMPFDEVQVEKIRRYQGLHEEQITWESYSVTAIKGGDGEA